jgi:hypothetical protein
MKSSSRLDQACLEYRLAAAGARDRLDRNGSGGYLLCPLPGARVLALMELME